MSQTCLNLVFNQTIEEINKVGQEKLWALAEWSKETNNLQPFQRGIIGSVANRLKKGREPSEKQAKQIMKAINEAESLGFSFEATDS